METLKEQVDFVFLLPGKEFSNKFLSSWTATIVWLLEHNYSFISHIVYSPIVSETRNILLAESPTSNATKMGQDYKSRTLFNNEIVCHKVIFIDSDMVWTVQDIKKLLFSEHDVINGIAPFNFGDNVSVSTNHKWLTKKDIKEIKEPFEVDFSGLSFAAIKYKVLENITYPYFKTLNELNKDEKYETTGEDVYFYDKIKKAGYKIMADPNILIGHEKLTVLRIDC
jgi:hypothetical protein